MATSRYGRPIIPTFKTLEGDVSMLKLSDTDVSMSKINDTDVSMIKFIDTVDGNPEDSPLEFDDGINITSTQHNVREKIRCHRCKEEESQIICDFCEKCFCVKCETTDIESEECKKEIYQEMLVAKVARVSRKEKGSYKNGLKWQCEECSTQEEGRNEQQIKEENDGTDEEVQEMKIQIKIMTI